MNANDFRMSLIVVGLAALGGYGQQVQAEPPPAVGHPVGQPIDASGQAREEVREAKKAAREPIDDGGGLIDDTVITTIGEMIAVRSG